MSSDTRSNDGDMNDDDDATRPTEKATVPPPPDVYGDEDPEGEEATVLARIPDELLASARSGTEDQRAGLNQMFSRESGSHPPAPPRAAPPAEEGDALLDMLFDDARDDRGASPKPAPAAPPPRPAPPKPPVRMPPPRPMAAPPPVDTDVTEIDEATPPGGDADEVDLMEAPDEIRSAAPPPEVDAPTEDMDAAALDFAHEPDPEPEAEAIEAAEAPARAVPIPSRVPPPVAFDREEDANAGLLRSQQRDAWVARAEWLKAEADALDDAAARSRALLTVSELYAMAGEEAIAKQIAEEAQKLTASPLTHRQVRGILAREGEWAAALDVLDHETRAAATPAARVHGSLLGAEIARLCLSDEDGAKKRMDQALRGMPGDPRAHVQHIAEALAAPDPDDESPSPVARLRLPADHTELAPLVEALAQVQAHRGLTPATAIGRHPPKDPPPAGSVYESLLRLRASAAAGDHAGTVHGLAALALGGPALAGGAGWLAGVLAAQKKETRAEAAAALREVLHGSHGALARRALAARAIELDDAAAARAATDSAGSDAFSAADRVAIAALTGGAREDIGPWLDPLIGDPDLTPIAAAATAALGGGGPLSVGTPRGRAGAALGRELAAKNPAALRGAINAYVDAAPEAPISRALSLELDIEDGAGGRVARALSAWRDDADLAAERALASAVVAEASGEIERAKGELDLVRTADPRSEIAVRAAAAHADPEAAARLLAELAQSLEGGARAAVTLTEAAARIAAAGDAAEADALLRRAVEADRDLPLPYHLGAIAAHARGDRDALVDWLRSRREASDDAGEQAHDNVREALLLSDGDAAAAAPLLEAALAARPTDVALREIYERLAPEPPADRAAWREARAAETTGMEASRLALEAALEMERTGDLEGAARNAQRAVAAGENQLAPILAFRAALAGQSGGDIVDALLPRARQSADPVERLEIYERLAELDERGRGDAASGLLWRRTILEETPSHLPTLRRVASTLIGAGRDEELDAVALEIARALEGPESVAHAMLSARLRQKTATWDDTREAVDIAFKHTPRSIWALRQMAAHARVRGEHALAMECDRALGERTDRASETATLSLRAAQGALKAGRIEDALAFLAQTIDLAPSHLVAHLELASVLESTGNAPGAAASLEAAANACASPAERANILYRAAQLWQDKAQDPDHAREALEAVAAIDPSFADVFQRLRGIYIESGARAELAALLERRLEAVTDPAERVEMEVLRGRALADVGDAAAAKEALRAALDANPDHVEALSAFADVCAAEEDWAGAEDAWIKLARLVPDAEKQVAIYLRLGELYDDRLPNPERAELAYQEILKREPNDTRARERLVALYQRMGDAARAIEQQTLLVNAAEAPEQKCIRTTELAGIYEATGDTKKAENTLLQARKTWPKDDVALASLARFYLRNNQAQAATVLLDRAVADARRALGTGRFEPYLFSTIAAVADLKNRPDAARVAKAAVAAIDGGAEAALPGAGASAGDPSLDDLLAPDVLTPAFRDLLQKTGPLLDTAVPFDLTAVRAAPLPPQLAELGDQIRALAAGYGLPNIQVFSSNVLASVAMPVSTHPPTLVLGHPLVTSSREDVRTFLIHRALKVLQANASPISRTAPIDLWPLLAAYLKAFSPTWTPQGVDQGKLTDFYGRISRAMPKNLDPQVNILAAEVIGSIGNRAGTLNTVINGWGNRAGLLAVGDLNIAISGIAWAGGHTNQPPAQGKERVTWINRNAEARELVVFSVSDHYADARTKLGLTADEVEADVADVIE